MPVYQYKALNQKGKTVSGIIDTESATSARLKLRASNIYPTEIKEVYATDDAGESKSSPALHFFSRVSQGEIAMITRQLSTLVGAGFPLVHAIATLIPQSESTAFRKVLSQIKDTIEEGSSFAGALSLYPDTFSPVYINMVRAGETAGTLEIVLDQLADLMERQQELNDKIKSSMFRPILQTLLAIGVVYFMLTYIVPKITGIFEGMNRVLPMPTRILISASQFLQSYWWLLLGLIIISFVTFSRIKKTTKGRYSLDKSYLTMPFFGQLVKKIATARFSRTLGSLLENGVPMLTALGIVKNVVGNVLIADVVEMATKEVEKGNGLGRALENSKLLPHLSVQMIQVGEQSGHLEAMLSKVADVYEKDVESTMTSLTSLIEPISMLFMGIIVGFIMLSIVLPILEINQLVR